VTSVSPALAQQEGGSAPKTSLYEIE
jgi:hypothetical protein